MVAQDWQGDVQMSSSPIRAPKRRALEELSNRRQPPQAPSLLPASPNSTSSLDPEANSLFTDGPTFIPLPVPSRPSSPNIPIASHTLSSPYTFSNPSHLSPGWKPRPKPALSDAAATDLSRHFRHDPTGKENEEMTREIGVLRERAGAVVVGAKDARMVRIVGKGNPVKGAERWKVMVIEKGKTTAVSRSWGMRQILEAAGGAEILEAWEEDQMVEVDSDDSDMA